MHFITVFFLFYLYSHGIGFDNHGYYNIAYFFVIIIPALIIIYFLHHSFRLKRKKIILLYIEVILIFLFIFQITIYNSNGCEDWAKGLNETSIDNDKNKYGCIIQIPKSCYYKIGKYFLDINKYSNLNCKNFELYSKKNILSSSKSPYINKNTSYIGFPLINKEEKYFVDMNYQTYMNMVLENLIDMDNLTLINFLNDKKPEITVDFSKSRIGEMKIDINFNKTLSDKRKELEASSNPYSKNIMIIFIDSVSRANSLRKLKKTLKFFEQFTRFEGNYNKKFPFEIFHSFQFFKYHSHLYYTIGNYPILFYGNKRNFSNKYITSDLKKNGFVTGYVSDVCFNDFVRSYHNFSFDDIYDHHYAICDPNYLNLSPKLECFYGKLYIEYMFDYINQFWKKYNNNRKFALF